MRPNQRGSHRAQPAADQPAEQDADRQAEPDLDVADLQRRNPDQARPRRCAVATTNMSVTSVARSATPRCCDGTRDVRRDAADREHVAAEHAQAPAALPSGWPAARDSLEEHAARVLLLCEIRERPAVDRRIRHDDVEELARQVEQLFVVDSRATRCRSAREPRRASCAARISPRRRRPEESTACRRRRSRPRLRIRSTNSRSPAAASSSAATRRPTQRPPRSILHRLVTRSRAGHASGGGSPPSISSSSLRHSAARSTRSSFGPSCDKHPRGGRHADQIGDGEGDGDVVGHGRALGLGRVEVRDRVHGRADGGGFGQRARDEAGRRARVVAEARAKRHKPRRAPRWPRSRRAPRASSRRCASRGKNCGPVRKPIANRNSRKKHCLTSSGSVMPSWPTSTPASKVPVTAPSVNPPSEILPEEIAEAQNQKRMRSRDALSQRLRPATRHGPMSALCHGGRVGVEAAAEREMQVDALHEALGLHAHEGGARSVHRDLLLLHGAQVARAHVVANLRKVQSFLICRCRADSALARVGRQ